VRLEADGDQYNLGDAEDFQCCDIVGLPGRFRWLCLGNGDSGCRMRRRKKKGTEFVRVQAMDDHEYQQSRQVQSKAMSLK
jgi:hypothetical protein